MNIFSLMKLFLAAALIAGASVTAAENNWPDLVKQANMKLQQKKYTEVIQLLEGKLPKSISETDGTNNSLHAYAIGYNNLGYAYLNLKKPEKAIEALGKSKEALPNSPAAYYLTGHAYFEMKDYHKSIEGFEKGIQLNPGAADDKDLVALTISYFKINDKEKALKTFKTLQNKGFLPLKDATFSQFAEEMLDYDAIASNILGSDYIKHGQYQKAIEAFNEAIHLKADYAEAYSNRAIVYRELKQYQRAIEDYDRAIHLKRDCAECYYNRGLLYSDLDQHQRAIEDYDNAIRFKTFFADAYSNRGSAYAMLHKFQQAIDDLNVAISIQPSNIKNYVRRAAVYYMQGNNFSACGDAKKACELGDCKLLTKFNGDKLCR